VLGPVRERIDLKIALDVDGVISEAPAFFATLTHALQSAGHQIFIVTDHDEHFRAEREAELHDWGIAYDELVIVGDKEEFCRARGVDFALDDDVVEYYPHSASLILGLARCGSGNTDKSGS